MNTPRLFVPLILGLTLALGLLLGARILGARAASAAALPGQPRVASQAATRYVATDGVDSGGCDTITGRCLTLQYAAGQASDGDTIRAAQGT